MTGHKVSKGDDEKFARACPCARDRRLSRDAYRSYRSPARCNLPEYRGSVAADSLS